MYIRRILYSNIGRCLMSILLGLGLATLFRKACNGRDCLVFHAAPIDKIKNQIFKYNDKCYKFEDTAATCDKNKKTLKFK